MKVWNARTGEDVFSLPPGPEYFAAAFSPDPDGKYLVTGNAKGDVQVWDANRGQSIRQPIRTLGTHKGTIRGVVFSRDGKYLASVSSDGGVKLWDATRLGAAPTAQGPPELLHTFPSHVPGPGLNVAFSPDGKRMAIADKEYTVKIWDVETRRELRTLRGYRGHTHDVYTVAFSPDRDGRWVASAGEDSTVKVWDSQTGELRRTFRGHKGLITCLAFSPDGRQLFSGSRDKTVKIWDMTQLEEVPDR